MNWEHREVAPDATGAVLAADWRRGFNAMAERFNGNLDRDNFATNVFTAAHVEAGCFSKCHSDGEGAATTFEPDLKTLSWNYGPDGTGGHYLPYKVMEVPVDAVLVCHFGCHWEWTNVAASSPAAQDEIGCRFRLTVDGTEIALSDWSPMECHFDSVYLVGAHPVGPGKRTVRAEMQVGRVVDRDPYRVVIAGIDTFPLYVRNRELIVVEKRR